MITEVRYWRVSVPLPFDLSERMKQDKEFARRYEREMTIAQAGNKRDAGRAEYSDTGEEWAEYWDRDDAQWAQMRMQRVVDNFLFLALKAEEESREEERRNFEGGRWPEEGN